MWSKGQKVTENEWACCLADKSAAVSNKTRKIKDQKWYLVSTHTLDMPRPEIEEGDGGHNLWCFPKNQDVLVTPWVMETWMFFCSHQLLCAYTVCKHVANNKRGTLCTRLCAFLVVLFWRPLCFICPDLFFSPGCLQCWQHSDKERQWKHLVF